jgi:hypothetical protein
MVKKIVACALILLAGPAAAQQAAAPGTENLESLESGAKRERHLTTTLNG